MDESILIPIAICVVLPVSIVLIVYLAAMNSDNKRAQILTKAIEANPDIETDKLAELLQKAKAKKTQHEVLGLRLLRGCIFSLVGLIFIIMIIISLFAGEEFGSDYVSSFLLIGGVSLAIGISYLIVYTVTRKHIDDSKPD